MFSLIKTFSREHLTTSIDGVPCVVKITETFLFGKLRLLYKEEGTANQTKVKQFELSQEVTNKRIGFIQGKTKRKRKNENKGKEDTQMGESSSNK